MTSGRHPNCTESENGMHEWNDTFFCVNTKEPKVLCELCGYSPDDRIYHIIK